MTPRDSDSTDHFVPLGDQALLAYFRDERLALRFAARVRQRNAPWLVDVVPAYTSVAVFFDPDRTRYAEVAESLRELLTQADDTSLEASTRSHLIPCCYELGPDLERVAERTGLSPAEVVALHTGSDYTVYAIGFCPGFPYLGYLPVSLCGVPRLPSPRLRVEAGSVGLTGRQTGIYTEERPGGWNLVGRTPLVLVDVADGYFPLRAGDRVRFLPIDRQEYTRLEGTRL
jgi:inhibitor of KinA